MVSQNTQDDVRKLMLAGSDVELILLFLRDRGFDKIDSINTIRSLMGKSTPEAKDLIDTSKTWSDYFYNDLDLHNKARRAFLELAASGDEDLPRIELTGFDESES